MSLLLVTLLLPPVALNHNNRVTIGFVIHKNLQKYVHDISNLMAAKWGRFNRQMSNSKMAAKTEDGGAIFAPLAAEQAKENFCQPVQRHPAAQ